MLILNRRLKIIQQHDASVRVGRFHDHHGLRGGDHEKTPDLDGCRQAIVLGQRCGLVAHISHAAEMLHHGVGTAAGFYYAGIVSQAQRDLALAPAETQVLHLNDPGAVPRAIQREDLDIPKLGRDLRSQNFAGVDPDVELQS